VLGSFHQTDHEWERQEKERREERQHAWNVMPFVVAGGDAPSRVDRKGIQNPNKFRSQKLATKGAPLFSVAFSCVLLVSGFSLFACCSCHISLAEDRFAQE
jgi:hypothetical protein